MITERFATLSDKEAVAASIRVLELLLMKVQALPRTPGDSLSNAIKAQEAINVLESVPVEKVNDPINA